MKIEKNVSVIIPSYNRSKILKITVPSYIQDVTLEVIIVDDGSSDNTEKQVKYLYQKYGKIKYIRLREHKGLPYAKNAGVRKAIGKYIFFGDDDSVLYEGTLRRLRDAIEKFPADIAGVNGSYAASMWQIKNYEKYVESQFTKPFCTNCIVDFNTGKFDYNYKIKVVTEGLYVMSSFLIKAQIAKETRFDCNYIKNAAREDMDYLVRLAKKGKKMVYVPDTYEVDLPRSYAKGGGSHSLGQWRNGVYSIRNNNLFINRHYEYLKENGYLTVSKFRAKWNFGIFVIHNLLKIMLAKITVI